MLRALLIAAIVAAVVTVPAQAQQLDVIRARCSAPRKTIEDAKVTATSLSGNVNRSARTDKNGVTQSPSCGEGDYFVEVAAIGYAAGDSRSSAPLTRNPRCRCRLLRTAGQLDTSEWSDNAIGLIATTPSGHKRQREAGRQ